MSRGRDSATISMTWPIAHWPNPNRDRRKHWTTQRREARAIRSAAALLAQNAAVTVPSPVQVIITWTFPDARARDIENWSTKALIDGICDGGLLAEDSSRHLSNVTKRIDQNARSDKGTLRVDIDIVAISAATK